MILKVKDFQDSCKKILEAVDTTTKSIRNETLELKEIDGKLHLNVTNREYFASVILDGECEKGFRATVDAKLFLPLIAKITTEELELIVKDNTLVIKGNGRYKLPMIYEDINLLELTEITIDNPTTTFTINSDVLLSILTYNSKEVTKNTITRPVQKMYYVDDKGCITFTQSACVNYFELPQPIKILLTDKLVKLFKLFPKDTDIEFTLGYDEVGGILQTKVSFKTENIKITSILTNDESMLVSVPERAIRGRANTQYKYSINIDRDSLIDSIDRLLLFTQLKNQIGKTCAKFEFTPDRLILSDLTEDNKEPIPYVETKLDETYSAYLDLLDIRMTLENCTEKYLTLHFGDGQAFVVSRGNIKNVIPEVHLM